MIHLRVGGGSLQIITDLINGSLQIELLRARGTAPLALDDGTFSTFLKPSVFYHIFEVKATGYELQTSQTKVVLKIVVTLAGWRALS